MIAALQGMRRDLERLARTARTVPPDHLEQADYCHLIQTGARAAAMRTAGRAVRPVSTDALRPASKE